MSSEFQTIWFGIAIALFIGAAFSEFRSGEHRNWTWIHPGWLGLAAFTIVFFWTALQSR